MSETMRRAVRAVCRRLPTRPEPPPPAGLQHAIERFSFFQGTLRIVGWVRAPGADIKSLDLVLPDGAAHRLGHIGAPGGAVRFDQTAPLQANVSQVANATLRIRFRDRGPASIARLGDVAGDPAHALATRFQDMLRDRSVGAILEIGSRARSGITRRDYAPGTWTYSGLDVMAGPNVDVVGDAHRLSSLYPAGHFDAVMSFSVLEHLLMPWKFVVELNRVMKPGALGIFTTHQCWPLHDQPWDFWRFSDKAWTGLLNGATGFEILDAQMGEPCFVVAERCHAAVAFDGPALPGLASFVLFQKVSDTTLEWPVELDAITATSYPTVTTDIRRAQR